MSDLRQNFIYPKITHEHRKYGATNSVGTILREDGDWRPYLPPEEYQKVNGVDSSACFIEVPQHTIATILEEEYGILDQNFAARFNALLSDATEVGGDPIAGADSIRHDGLIRQELMPFSNDILSWNDFHSWKNVNESVCRYEGQEWLKKWKPNYDIVFEKDYPLEIKYIALRDALKKSPVGISIYGATDNDGNYITKPSWAIDTHLVEAVYVDKDNCIWVWDTYAPFLKKLPPNYNPDFGMYWGLTKIEEKKSFWDYIISLAKWFFREKLVYREFKLFLIDYYKKK